MAVLLAFLLLAVVVVGGTVSISAHDSQYTNNHSQIPPPPLPSYCLMLLVLLVCGSHAPAWRAALVGALASTTRTAVLLHSHCTVARTKVATTH